MQKGEVNMWCSDPSINYLQSLGYSVIRLPKEDVKPLEILMLYRKDLERIGELSTLLVSGSHIALPPVSQNNVAANVTGKRTGELSAGVGLSILSTVLAAMGGSTLGLDAQYSLARSIMFEFHDVLEDRVEVAKLDQYLADADISPFSRYVADMLESDAIYVTTATIKSKKFGVEAKTSSGDSVAVSLPQIQGVVGGHVSVSQQGEGTNQLTYEGVTPLVFGFKAIRIFYDEGRYSSFIPAAPSVGMKDIEMERIGDVEYLKSDGPFLRLRG
jgi:hypothetical protein